jgi:hypothetical protein
VLSIDPTGKRACVACRCGGVHVVSVEALRGGAVVCGAIPRTSKQIAQQRSDTDQHRRQRELSALWRGWG